MRCLFSAAGKEDPAYRFFASLPDFYLSEEEGCEYAVPLAELVGAEKLMAAERCVKTPEEFFSLPLQEQKAFVQSQREAGSFYLEDLYSRRDELVPRLCLCSRNGGRRRCSSCREKTATLSWITPGAPRAGRLRSSPCWPRRRGGSAAPGRRGFSASPRLNPRRRRS